MNRLTGYNEEGVFRPMASISPIPDKQTMKMSSDPRRQSSEQTYKLNEEIIFRSTVSITRIR
jgi:hypothetical protein